MGAHAFGSAEELMGPNEFITTSAIFENAGAGDGVMPASTAVHHGGQPGQWGYEYPNMNKGPGSTVSDAGTFVLTETSLPLHCWGENPVVTAKLQLNTRSPDSGINVYSFALRPEEHQPSGTCNFS